MFGMSMWEILVVFALLFIVVGPGKLPGLAKKLGDQIRGLRQSLADVKATVDKDDEFVKAVSEARQSVAEAKEAVRGIIDDVVNVTEDLDGNEAARDPAPRPVPKGRRMVSRAGRGGAAGDEDGGGDAAPRRPEPPTPAQGPALAEDPVEAEDWRASTRGDRTDDGADDETDDEDPDAVERVDDGGVPRRTQPRGSTGRRMIKPGRSRTER